MENKINVENSKKVYFVGIGGVGMSALARMLKSMGKNVYGSDGTDSPITESLKQEGVAVHIGHLARNITEDMDLVIYSGAVRYDNSELIEAREKGIVCLNYFQALGRFLKGKRVIAVSGTNGKTTTTAMIAHVMLNLGMNPTVIVGSVMNMPDGVRTNFHHGSSDIAIVESCEYQRHFLEIDPWMVVITNIEADHLDYYKDIEDITDAFSSFVKKIPDNGFLICNSEDNLIKSIEKKDTLNVVDWMIGDLSEINLLVPGEHNIQNAQCALAVLLKLGVQKDEVLHYLSTFIGTWRRSEFKGETKSGALIFDDYAHHPTSVRMTIDGFIKKYPQKNINIIFQPHLYSRTKSLLQEFAQSFDRAFKVYILPIYGSREQPDESISSLDLVEAANKISGNVLYVANFNELKKIINNSNKDDIWITMGAGDVWRVGEEALLM